MRFQAAIDLHMAGRHDEAQAACQDVLNEIPDHAAALCLYGVVMQQKGQYATALVFLRRALALQPDNPSFLCALANALRAMHIYAEAGLLLRRAALLEPGNLLVKINYGSVLQQLKEFALAIACYRDILAIDGQFFQAYNDMGVAQLALQQYTEAAVSFQQAIAIHADYAEAHNNLGVAYKNQQQWDLAAPCFHTALQCNPGYFRALSNLGTMHFTRHEYGLALQMYRESLALDNSQLEVHQNLASILLDKGMLDEAQYHRDCAYRMQSIFVERVQEPIRTVVILWAADNGNVPVDHLFPKSCYTRIICVMEYVSDQQMDTLPDYDLVFNAIGDQDVTGPTQAAVQRFRSVCRKPFFNLDTSVAKTARDNIPVLFAGIAHTVCAPTLRCATDAFKESVFRAADALRFPIIVRPAASHGGEHLVKLDSPQQLQELKLFNAPVYYASNYIDYQSADGYFRKYRVVFVNREAFPYHLAISTQWMVHYKSADMLAAPWKCEEETAFLQNPRTVLGNLAMDAIEHIGRTMDLDFCGVDFSILPDGRVLVFEANATMLVHGEQPGVLQHKNEYVRSIFDAFNHHVVRAP